ncbi:MAG: hypothetical protein Q8L73_00135 [Methylotenera sp.]|nr:hypothetical protein [Methylotenera sp.]
MLGAEALLTAMWRGDSIHQIGTLKNGNFKNIPVKSIPDALQLATELSAKGFDVYFACGEYATPENRKASNALGAWGYWFDIDCGEAKAAKGLGYTTKKEANTSLLDFIKQTKLPYPDFIVDSGNGLHVYFCSDEFIPKSEWQAGARKLKALTKQYGLLADDTRTADIASVLRFPNTSNYKDPSSPKEVKVVYPKRGEV